MDTLGLRPGTFGFSLLRIIEHGDFSLFDVRKTKANMEQIRKASSRRMSHIQNKIPMAEAMATKIIDEVDKNKARPTAPPEAGRIVVSTVIKKERGVVDTPLVEKIEFSAAAHPSRSQYELIPKARVDAIQTSAQSFPELEDYLQEKAKRKIDADAPTNEPKRIKVQMKSFDAQHTKVSDLADKTLEYAYTHTKKVKSNIQNLHRFIEVTPKDVQAVLFIPFDAKQKHCVMGNLCQSMMEPLKHPLRNEPCMGFFSPIVWNALRTGEQLSPLHTEAENRSFQHSQCEFCFRKWVTDQVGTNMLNRDQIPRQQIASRHYSTDLPGSWDKSAMIAPEREKKSQRLNGLLGNVPFFNPLNFRPMVAIMNQEWEIQKWLEVEDYKKSEKDYATTRVAFGWLETGPFYEMNNMMQPKVNHQDPYLNVIMEVKGGYNISSVLAGYFRKCEGRNYSHIFLPFNELLKRNVFTLDYPGFHPQLIGEFENQGRLRDPSAENPYEKYWPWNEDYVMHSIDLDLPYENYSIYYTAIWVLNSLVYLKRLNAEIPPSIVAKLESFADMYLPLLNWMQTHTLDDATLRSMTMKLPDEDYIASVFYVLYPRHGEAQKKFRIEDFQYLEFEYKQYRRYTPEQQLEFFYLFEKKAELPHSEDFVRDYCKFDEYIASKKQMPFICYPEVTDTFKRFFTCLRRHAKIDWPVDTISHLGNADTNPEFQLKKTEDFFRKVHECFVNLLAFFKLENLRYEKLVAWLPHVLCPFDKTVAWIARCLNTNGSAVNLMRRLGVRDFSHLLPSGFVANTVGINNVSWRHHCILLALLVRVHITQELHGLESACKRTVRNNLILLRNSHFALLRAILERGFALPVKTDVELRSRAAIRPGMFSADFTRGHQLTVSIYDANFPVDTREVHEGQLPRSYFMLAHNFFTELEKPSFRFQKILSLTLLKCTVHSEFLEIINSEENSSLRRLLYFLLELSLKGLYKSANVVPSFRVSMQIDEMFRNLDYAPVRQRINAWLNTVLKRGKEGEDKLCFHQFIDHLFMEYAYFNLRCNPTAHDMILQQYCDDFWSRSLTVMDIVRNVLDRQRSLKLEDIHYYTQEKFDVKVSHKVMRPNKIPFWTFFQFTIIQCDKERYNSRKFCEKISEVDVINIQDFVRHLDPNGTLYKNDLLIPFNGIQSLVDCVNAVYEIHKQCTNATNIVSLTKQAIEEVHKVSIAHYPLLARVVTELYAYRKYKSMEIIDRGFIEKSIKMLCLNSACDSIDQVPIGRSIACIAPCCSTLKKSLASKQFKPVQPVEGRPIINSTLGNRDLAIDPADRRITCGIKNSRQGKRSTQVSLKQRSKKAANKGTSLQMWRKTENLKLIALGQQAQITDQLQGFAHNEETINKLVETQRLKEGIGLTCESTEPLVINALGAVIECEQNLKINGAKRREAQRLKSLSRQKPDPMRVQHNNRLQNTVIGMPPLIISTCCGELSSYNFLGYTGAGYCCGWCLPRANEFAAFRTENICEICYQTLANSPTLNKCPVPNCSKEYTKCPHGAFPIIMYDDLRWMCVRKVYVCDSCFRKFDKHTNCNFFYALSVVKNGFIEMVRTIISR
jgi:hypothetical protein